MEKILPIGSVVELEQGKHLIVGTRMELQDGVQKLAYVSLPFPLGYIEFSSISEFFADSIKSVVFEGDSTNPLITKWSKGYNTLLAAVEGKTEEETKQIFDTQEIKKVLDQVKKDSKGENA